jgi:threonine dehydrogenase-like Zn-dependent dehydrogenase
MKAAVMEEVRKPLVVRMIGSYGMPAPRFDAMLQMVQSGKLAPGKLVSRTVPLEEAGSVLASMDSFATVGVTVIDRY